MVGNPDSDHTSETRHRGPPFESSAQRFAQVTVHQAQARITVAEFLIWKRLKKLRKNCFQLEMGFPQLRAWGYFVCPASSKPGKSNSMAKIAGFRLLIHGVLPRARPT